MEGRRPFDGVLEDLRGFGKRFHPDMQADALLFKGEPAALVPVDPKFFPITLANRLAVFGRSARGWNLFQHIRPRLVPGARRRRCRCGRTTT